jgi:alpha-L-rhamnosidase
MQAKNYNYTTLIISTLKYKGYILPVAITLVLLFPSCQTDHQPVSVNNLKCEYLSNPLGIDCKNPHFNWQLKSDANGASQQAYQIIVGTDSAGVSNGNGNQWASGTINGNPIPAIYNGPALEAFTRYYWAVKIKNNNSNWTPLSKISWFETGMLGQANWNGAWITDTHDYDLRPASLFRKSFQIQKPVKSARAYIAVGGLYELSLNGEKIKDHVLDPMFTRFDRRNL